MDRIDVEDEMAKSIAMFTFMTEALDAITMSGGQNAIDNEKSFGMQQIFSFIEENFKAIQKCLLEEEAPAKTATKSHINK